jgi:hypothetical protein
VLAFTLLTMNKSAFIVILLSIFRSISSFGQAEDTTLRAVTSNDSVIARTEQGTINWNVPSGLNNLLESYKRENFKEQGIDGYRIQLFSDGGNNAKDRAQTMLDELLRSYPDVSSYLTYQQPNFKVRIGNFRTKVEARQFQTILSQNYPGCFIVRDLIKVN